MKKILVSIVSVVLVLSSSLLASAQNKDRSKSGGGKEKTERTVKTPAQIAQSRFKKVNKELSFSEKQGEKVLSLFMAEAAKAEKAMADGEEFRLNLSAKNKELTAGMKNVLDEVQYEKWMESGVKKSGSGSGKKSSGSKKPAGKKK